MIIKAHFHFHNKMGVCVVMHGVTEMGKEMCASVFLSTHQLYFFFTVHLLPVTKSHKHFQPLPSVSGRVVSTSEAHLPSAHSLCTKEPLE